MALIDWMVTAVVPVLVRVTGRVEADPSGVALKRRGIGDSSTRLPKPVIRALCGLLASLSFTESLAVLFPVALGENVTQILHAGVQLPSALCGLRTVAAVQYVATPVEQSVTGVQLFPVTENSGSLLTMELMVSGVGREFETSRCRVMAVLPTPIMAVPITTRVAESSGHWRGVRMRGGSGIWLKLKLSVMSLAFASRVLSGGRPKRSSINFNTDENSYWVGEMCPFLA